MALPWEGISSEVKDLMTAKEVLEKTGLNWKVRKEPHVISLTRPEGNILKCLSGRFLNVREGTNDVLGLVGKNFTLIQNDESMGFLDALTHESEELKYENAGFLGVGERIFVTMLLSTECMDIGGIKIFKHISFTNSFDGKKKLTLICVPYNKTSATTMNISYGGLADKITVKHSKNLASRLKEANKVLKLTDNYFSNLEETFDKLLQVEIDEERLSKVLDSVMPLKVLDRPGKTEKARETVRNLYTFSNITYPSIAHTGFSLLNAFSKYADDYKKYKVTDKNPRTQFENRFSSIIEGETQKLKNRVTDNLLDL